MSTARLVDQITDILNESDLSEEVQTKVVNTLVVIKNDLPSYIPSADANAAMDDLDIIIDSFTIDEDEDEDDYEDEDEGEEEEL